MQTLNSRSKILQQRYIPILVVFAITTIISVIGYFLPEQKEEIPTRVLFKNTGGTVVFDHKVHAEKYDIACIECHHEMATVGETAEINASILDCGSCHGVDFNADYIASHEELFTSPFQCATCHHLQYDKTDWGHKLHAEDMGLDCYTCHHDDESITNKEENCASCHKAEAYEYTKDSIKRFLPSLKDAVHARCMDCHQDYYDEGLAGCNSCHTDISSRDKLTQGMPFEVKESQGTCASCHEGLTGNDLIRGRMDAFHVSCMTCHEDINKGPYKSNECAQCHL